MLIVATPLMEICSIMYIIIITLGVVASFLLVYLLITECPREQGPPVSQCATRSDLLVSFPDPPLMGARARGRGGSGR